MYQYVFSFEASNNLHTRNGLVPTNLVPPDYISVNPDVDFQDNFSFMLAYAAAQWQIINPALAPLFVNQVPAANNLNVTPWIFPQVVGQDPKAFYNQLFNKSFLAQTTFPDISFYVVYFSVLTAKSLYVEPSNSFVIFIHN